MTRISIQSLSSSDIFHLAVSGSFSNPPTKFIFIVPFRATKSSIRKIRHQLILLKALLVFMSDIRWTQKHAISYQELISIFSCIFVRNFYYESTDVSFETKEYKLIISATSENRMRIDLYKSEGITTLESRRIVVHKRGRIQNAE